MKSKRVLAAAASLCLGTGLLLAAPDPVFSGPQPGEKTAPFKVVEMTGPNADKERDPIAENDGKPTALDLIAQSGRPTSPSVSCSFSALIRRASWSRQPADQSKS
jgi:hypothetical protein